jgi:hypothetical protein
MPEQPFASVTVTVTAKTPAAAGAPDRSPLPESVIEDGSPVCANAYGGVPPIAAIVPVYGTPTVPAGRASGEIVSPAHTVSVNACVVEHPFGSVAVTVNEKVPVWVGAPEKAPEGRSVSPGGSPAVAVNV